MFPCGVAVVAIEPYALKLPMIADMFHKWLSLDLICFYSTIAFRLHGYDTEKDIDLLLVDNSPASLELIGTLRKASKNFPIVVCVEDDEAFERVRSQTVDSGAVFLHRKDDDRFFSLVQLVKDILGYTVS